MNRVSMARNITSLGTLDNWHQDLEYGPRNDIFDPVDPEI